MQNRDSQSVFLCFLAQLFTTLLLASCGGGGDASASASASGTADGSSASTGTLSLMAGSEKNAGSNDGTGSNAQFGTPDGIGVDLAGNVYVADLGNRTLRKITPSRTVTTLAGKAGAPRENVDGQGEDARFDLPGYVAVDTRGNVYVSDYAAQVVRKVTPSGFVSTFWGTPYLNDGAIGTYSGSQRPGGLAVDSGDKLYVTQPLRDSVIKLSSAGVPESAIGSGYDQPRAIARDISNNVYVSSGLSFINKITPSGVVSTLPTGVTDSSLGLAVDTLGNIYFTTNRDQTIKKMTPSGAVSVFAGKSGIASTVDGPASAARFIRPVSLSIDASDNLYVTDYDGHNVRKITAGGLVTTLAGPDGAYGYADGIGASARFNQATHIAKDSAGNMYVADSYNATVRKITPAGVVTTLAGSPEQTGTTNATGSLARFGRPVGIAVDSSDNVFVADQANCTVRKITPTGAVSTFAGTPASCTPTDGTGSAARFSNSLRGMAIDATNNIYVSDGTTIRKITPLAVTTTFAGDAFVDGSSDGSGTAAHFSAPDGIAVASSGLIYVNDRARIARISAAGVVSTVVSSLLRVGGPYYAILRGIAVDGTDLYVVDAANSVRKISASGVVTDVAGSSSYSDQTTLGSLPGQLRAPYGIVRLSSKTFALVDGNAVLKLSLE